MILLPHPAKMIISTILTLLSSLPQLQVCSATLPAIPSFSFYSTFSLVKSTFLLLTTSWSFSHVLFSSWQCNRAWWASSVPSFRLWSCFRPSRLVHFRLWTKSDWRNSSWSLSSTCVVCGLLCISAFDLCGAFSMKTILIENCFLHQSAYSCRYRTYPS